jgi:phosphate transport system permease protein
MNTGSPGRPRSARWRVLKNRIFLLVCIATASVSVIALAWLLYSIGSTGASNLIGLDREGRAEAMEPQAPYETIELERVDWNDVPEALPAAAQLADIDWSDFGAAQDPDVDLEFIDQLGDADWSAAGFDAANATALADVDWAATAEALRMPGAGWLGATWKHSRLGRFVTSPTSRRANKAGIGPALFGTLWICVVCALFSLPIGVGTAILLEEYKPKHRVIRALHQFIELNISNLAGVPSIVYGIIGLTAFVHMFGIAGSGGWSVGNPESFFYFELPFGRGALAGGLTLMLVILPVIIISTQEALRSVPDSLRQGSLALGATRWQVIRRMTLPSAVPGIMTGAILAMSRAIGEAAPVLIISAVLYIRTKPAHLMDDFTALPLQIYDWAGRPQEEFHAIAASGIIILLAALLTFNGFAIFVRQTFQRPLQ